MGTQPGDRIFSSMERYFGRVPNAKKFARGGAYVGIVCGVLYSFGGFVVDLLTVGLNWGTAMAFGALLGMPVIFCFLGFVLGAFIDLGGALFERSTG